MPKLNQYAILKLIGAVLAAVSCIPMLAALPGGIVAALGLLGITAASAPIVALAAPLAPIAQPLLLISIGLLIVGNLRCGWLPAFLAAIGGLLIYLAMYVLVIPFSVMDAMTMGTMPGMPGLTNGPLFYIGLAALVVSFGLSWWRQRKHICQPVHPLNLLRSAFTHRAS